MNKEQMLKRLAMNIVNQLFDLADVSVEKRQAINDEADAFVLRLLQQTDCSTLREILVQMQHRQAELFQLAKDKTEKESVIKNMEGISTVLRLVSDMPPVA